MEPTSETYLCPSAPMTQGSLLFATIDGKGSVSYRSDTLPVSKLLLRELPVRETSERKFRFAAPCLRSSCVHWADKCSLGSNLAEFQAFGQAAGDLLPIEHGQHLAHAASCPAD